MKRCSDCGCEKPLDSFSPNKMGAQGRYPACRPCNNERNRQRRIRRAEAEGRTFYGTAATDEERRQRDYVAKRRDYLKRKYGLSLEEYDEMFRLQDGSCAACRAGDVQLHIDHDHATGRVRALLCSTCNQALGMFGEDIARIMDAVAYLREHSHAVV